jgi:YVTN family beta-propeller protein
MDGDPDHDFASMMIAHHRGAIAMAVVELRFGRDRRLQRLAQEIIATRRSTSCNRRFTIFRNGTPMNAKSAAFAASAILLLGSPAAAGQAPESSASPDRPASARDRVYLSDQTSNTVSVVDPANNRLLGVIRLGMTPPVTLSPLYTGQLLVHGMGFSPDHRTLDVVSVGSNSVTFIDTTTNRVNHTTYVGRSPHEAFFTPDGKEVWVTIRGENYVSVLDAATYREKMHIVVPNGPGMTIFSPDGRFVPASRPRRS